MWWLIGAVVVVLAGGLLAFMGSIREWRQIDDDERSE